MLQHPLAFMAILMMIKVKTVLIARISKQLKKLNQFVMIFISLMIAYLFRVQREFMKLLVKRATCFTIAKQMK